MSRQPLLIHEVKLNKISFSPINENENKHFCYVKYKDNESLYLQTPIFKFIEPIKKINSNGKIYNEIYLFLTPHDSTTFSFIDLINSIELKSVEYINSILNSSLMTSKVIKSSNLDDEENSGQVIKYLKVKLLEQTKIEYNTKYITISELNKLTNKVNLKFIFELNMLWFNTNKVGLYLKPLKIKVIDIIPEADFEFRDEQHSDSPYDNNYTENDNIKSILNNQDLILLNESIFDDKHKQDLQKNTNSTLFNYQTVSDSISISKLGAFIPMTINMSNNNLQKKLKDELFVMENIKEKNNSRDSTKSSKKNLQNQVKDNTPKNIKQSIESVSDLESISSSISKNNSSSVRIEQLSRKTKNKKSNSSTDRFNKQNDIKETSKKRGRPKKVVSENKQKSIDQLKKLLSDETKINNNNSETDSLDICFEK